MDFASKFNEFPLIETKRIRLRKIVSDDALELFDYYKNKNVHQYLDWYGPETLEKSYKVIELWNQGYIDGWIIRFAIADIVTNNIIGTIFLNGFDGKRAEVGYELSEVCWRKGIMSEALKEVLKFGFDQLDLTRIQALVCEDNIGSRNMLEKQNFKEEGYLRQFECHSVTGECKDMYIYSLLSTEFER